MTESAEQPAHPPISPHDILRLKRCPRCEYDLTGLPRRSHCPECGFTYSEKMFVLHVPVAGSQWRFVWYVAGFGAAALIWGVLLTMRFPMMAVVPAVAVLLGMIVIVIQTEYRIRLRRRQMRGSLLFNQKGIAIMRKHGWSKVIPYSAFARVTVRRSNFGKGWRLQLFHAPPIPMAWASVHLDLEERLANILRHEISTRLQACPKCGYNLSRRRSDARNAAHNRTRDFARRENASVEIADITALARSLARPARWAKPIPRGRGADVSDRFVRTEVNHQITKSQAVEDYFSALTHALGANPRTTCVKLCARGGLFVPL